jgi:hypothetical protein
MMACGVTTIRQPINGGVSLIVALLARCSQFVHQVTNANAKSLCYPQKRVQAYPLLTPLDFANVNRMQVGFFCQLFLTHAKMLATIPNGVAQNFQLSRTRHSFLAKHLRPKMNTPNMGLFCYCMFLGKSVET